MNCCACMMILCVDLNGRIIPVNVEFVQTVTAARTDYDFLDASLDLATLRTISIFEAEQAIYLARTQFINQLNRGANV